MSSLFLQKNCLSEYLLILEQINIACYFLYDSSSFAHHPRNIYLKPISPLLQTTFSSSKHLPEAQLSHDGYYQSTITYR